jgi:hypothetical protein
MAQQTRSLRQQAQQEFAQSLDQLGADLDFGDDLWAELAQLPEVELAEPLDAPFPEIAGALGDDRSPNSRQSSRLDRDAPLATAPNFG